ncbi:MAG: acetate--CoA ligase family protein [Candidatus Micrarchaeia archaeon]
MTLLEYFKAKALLDKFGIKSVDAEYVKTPDEAIAFANGNAIALKALSDKALHKSKAGLVMLNLDSEKAIREAFSRLSENAKPYAPYKILAQKMSSGGVEAILGGNTDNQFGKVVLIGLGGIYVEIFKDTALRLCPITRYDAMEMINQLKAKDIITHGGKATNMVVNLLMKFSRLFEKSNIKEIDLNPVFIREKDYEVVDIRMIV